jgi:hypothetical protein
LGRVLWLCNFGLVCPILILKGPSSQRITCLRPTHTRVFKITTTSFIFKYKTSVLYILFSSCHFPFFTSLTVCSSAKHPAIRSGDVVNGIEDQSLQRPSLPIFPLRLLPARRPSSILPCLSLRRYWFTCVLLVSVYYQLHFWLFLL